MNKLDDQQLSALADRLALSFNQPCLLRQALTHRSASGQNNERLEFLGDSLLNFIIAEALYQAHGRWPEGDLSRLRAHLVKGDTLAEIAREIGLSDYLILGGGELKRGGYRRDSILADAVEAIIAATYLDQGIEACRRLVLQLFEKRLDAIDPKKVGKDPKTRLQEWLQKRKLSLPKYEVLNITGPAHNQTFEVACQVEGQPPFTAEAGSRRKAEQRAAEKALEQLERANEL